MSKTIKAVDLHTQLVRCMASNGFNVKTVYTIGVAFQLSMRFEFDCMGNSRLQYEDVQYSAVSVLVTDSEELKQTVTSKLKGMSNTQLYEFLALLKLVMSPDEWEAHPEFQPSKREILLKSSVKLTNPSVVETTATALLTY